MIVHGNNTIVSRMYPYSTTRRGRRRGIIARTKTPMHVLYNHHRHHHHKTPRPT
jgi:hypothetical protein